MDYILSDILLQVEERSQSYKEDEGRGHVEYLRMAIEYAYVFMLGYLWNKNRDHRDRLDPETSAEIFRQITESNISIGTIGRTCASLDQDRDRKFISKAKAEKLLELYPEIRNKKIGHGYNFGDTGVKDTIKNLENIYNSLFTKSRLQEDFHIIRVDDIDISGRLARGYKFPACGRPRTSWTCSLDVVNFERNNVYAMEDVDNYTRLSPFIHIKSDQFYLFKRMQERMVGRIAYIHLFHDRSSEMTIEWPELAADADISRDNFRRNSKNGTIRNNYDNNFSQYGYIEIGTEKEDIYKFLIDNTSSVCGTVWGHGGVGKTATVQRICEDLSQRSPRVFDYIVFASAKDRYFQYTTGTGSVKAVDDEYRVNSYSNLISRICSTINIQNKGDEDGLKEIKEFQGKLLIVIDDYETFPEEEKTLIETLIDGLNVNRHKVLITTRARVRIGNEFTTHELNEEETVKFFRKVLEQLDSKEDDNAIQQNKEQIFSITGGRPLFIFQLAYICCQDSLRNALNCDIKNQKAAVDFLFGRIFNYLEPLSRKIFCAIGCLDRSSELPHEVKRLCFIVNMEKDKDNFDTGFEVLKKLKLIEEKDGFFSVYSEEIWTKMSEHYQEQDNAWQAEINHRLKQVIGDSDLERALLKHADSMRFGVVTSVGEIKASYERILGRASSPENVKSKAILNLTAYLFGDRSEKEEAIKVFERYHDQFDGEPDVAKMHANYCWTLGGGGETIEYNHYQREVLQWREKAIKVLTDCLDSTEGPKIKKIGIRAIYIGYHSKMLIDHKNKLSRAEQRREMEIQEITQSLIQFANNQGNAFMNIVRGLTEDEIQNLVHDIATGLDSLSEVWYILRDFEKVAEICGFLIEKEVGINLNTITRIKRRLEMAHNDWAEGRRQGRRQGGRQGGRHRPGSQAAAMADAKTRRLLRRAGR